MTTFNTQPQIAQFELLFKGPLVKDQQVEVLSDLITLDIKNAYEHKIVWVKEIKSWYYLYAGNGTDINNWRKLVDKASIKPYQLDETYQEFECVYLSGKLYSALQQVPVEYTPLDSPDYWLCISGDSITFRYFFQNASSVLIYTDIKNPIFEIILGDIIYEYYEPVIDPNTGLILLENEEKVEAYIKRREDLENNNGVPYEIIFYENEILTEQSAGYINVK